VWWLIFLIVAGVTTVGIITLNAIVEAIREIELKKRKKYISAKIDKIYKEGNYKVVEIGLIDSLKNKEKLILKGKEIDNSLYVKQEIPI